MVNLKISGSREAQVQKTALQLAQLCRGAAKGRVEVLGPAPSPIDRIRDRYRWQVLLKGSEQVAIHTLCQQIIENQQRLAKGDIRIAIDVDPESMM